MEIPILKNSFNTKIDEIEFKDLVKNLYSHCNKLDEAGKMEFSENKQKISTETLYIIQDCIQILKQLKDSGYNIDIDFQVHKYKLRKYKKVGTAELKFNF
ncbi:hypothetical protein CPAST_c27110 [Clostridium pasteurianum DSM 525 = ATCC 6013]|uniref:Uncharacterized protein n=1 Tax=Clostridium pasteurianum DSM 525 = ATCC 6013 TaxID=1262449 RepID=A0A0H3J9J4_CLOPA|nr:hypothetical protein [Clostridium pasteurianum]AJA48778.1 hypothetical protein CPAST_c27110 [Clostridium pasteurianum DSM 525 = ATCC 6013]AJA52766.1 hypothetical protein CLPA_c27110 [Clostridium pasteurianum DSM 525 = ATCC 6013]AOZ75999.1 hypothetical protein AQ983_13175 [Clostridium pasteurianum DSM 525 = ATCC 6013]AOZ79795.1 hypothetical protein AQ984_13170 [Clostridium pasteurianum]ELP60076.1 hypothetical protein F502_05552 [Clostridium pasteurianum DSM 525 = ATCC 6013]